MNEKRVISQINFRLKDLTMGLSTLFKTRHYIVIIPTLAILCACGTTKEERMQAKPTEELIATAKENLSSKQFKTAIEYYDLVEARLPQGTISEESKLAKIYAYYRDRDPEKALAEANAFLRSFPNHPQASYAWYMKGMIDFDRALSVVDKLLPPDRSKIDPAQMKRSLESFETVVTRFPKSDYAEDSLQRATYLKNMLAKAEINVANFYMRRKAYLAVINRAQTVLDDYDRTPEVANALYLQVKAYRLLQLDDLASDRLRIFQQNFPEDPRLAAL